MNLETNNIQSVCQAGVWVAKFIEWWIDQDTGYPIEERCGKVRYFVRRDEAIYWADTRKELCEQFNLVTDEEKAEPRSVAFINSKLQDNALLMKQDPSYIANLKAMSTVERERLLMATPLSIFRLMAAEFAAIDDDTVLEWIELTRPLVSKKRFGRVYDQALALLTAHRMKTAGIGADGTADGGGLDDIGGIGAAFKVGSYSSGGESISFNTAALTSKLSPDAEFSQTVYGVQYLTLRDMNTIPIINAGESHGRC